MFSFIVAPFALGNTAAVEREIYGVDEGLKTSVEPLQDTVSYDIVGGEMCRNSTFSPVPEDILNEWREDYCEGLCSRDATCAGFAYSDSPGNGWCSTVGADIFDLQAGHQAEGKVSGHGRPLKRALSSIPGPPKNVLNTRPDGFKSNADCKMKKDIVSYDTEDLITCRDSHSFWPVGSSAWPEAVCRRFCSRNDSCTGFAYSPPFPKEGVDAWCSSVGAGPQDNDPRFVGLVHEKPAHFFSEQGCMTKKPETKTTPPTTPEDCFELDVDYYGYDLDDTEEILKARSAANTPHECMDTCADVQECKFWTFASACYLKTSSLGRTEKATSISGPKHCPSGNGKGDEKVIKL